MTNPSKHKNVAEALSALLADTYTLYLKTHNYHWNVTGPNFQSLHLLFENQYTELAVAVDDIAERIRTLGSRAPGSYAEFAKLSSVREATGTPAAQAMVTDLADDQAKVIDTLKSVWALADEARDEGTIDLLSTRLAVHEKAGWMLRSSI